MRYAKLALLLAVAAAPAALQGMTGAELEKTTVKTEMDRSRIVEISAAKDQSIAYFMRKYFDWPARLDLSQDGRHFRDAGFDETDINAFLNRRRAESWTNLQSLDLFVKKIAEAYFLLNEKGISLTTAKATYNFIKAAEGFSIDVPDQAHARLAMQILLTVAAKNPGQPLHTALGEGTPEADITASLYRKYNTASQFAN